MSTQKNASPSTQCSTPLSKQIESFLCMEDPRLFRKVHVVVRRDLTCGRLYHAEPAPNGVKILWQVPNSHPEFQSILARAARSCRAVLDGDLRTAKAITYGAGGQR